MRTPFFLERDCVGSVSFIVQRKGGFVNHQSVVIYCDSVKQADTAFRDIFPYGFEIFGRNGYTINGKIFLQNDVFNLRNVG